LTAITSVSTKHPSSFDLNMLFNIKNCDSKLLFVDCLSQTTAYLTLSSINNALYTCKVNCNRAIVYHCKNWLF